MIPSIGNILNYYPTAANAERAKTGQPGNRTVLNVVCGAKHVFSAAGLKPTDPLSELSRQKFDCALATFLQNGYSRVTAASYVANVRSLFSRWALPYYTDLNWQIPQFEFPSFRALAPRYTRPSDEQLQLVKKWYRTLTGEMWLAATFMLEFAMRNGDILRIRKSNFVRKDGLLYLDYIPHKTALTSGRRIFWPVHPSIWERISLAGGFDAFDVTDDTLRMLGQAMRSLGFHGNKSAYELRKICIDHVYQRYGAEMASSISGDDIKTVTRYYADPSRPNIANKRIIDLI